MKTPFYSRLFIVFTALLFITPEQLQAQITFQREYHRPFSGFGAGAEIVLAVAQDKNNPRDYYFAGTYKASYIINNPPQGWLIWRGSIVKINDKGDVQWAKSDTTSIGSFEDIKCVYDNNNSLTGLVACGGSMQTKNKDYSCFCITKTDVNGNTLYFKNYSGPRFTSGTRFGTCFKIEQTINTANSKNGFIAVGYMIDESIDTFEKIYLVHVDDTLGLEWSKIFSRPGMDSRGLSVKQTSDKGFIITGQSGTELFIIKTDALGNKSWQKIYDMTVSSMSVPSAGKDIIEVVNSSIPEYYVVGHNTDNIVVMKLDQSGNVLRRRSIKMPGSVENASGMVYLPSGHITISGTTTNDTAFLIKIDTGFRTKSFAKKYLNSRFSSSPVITNDNGYIIGGHADAGYYLIKTDGNGVSDCYEAPMNTDFDTLITLHVDTFLTATGYTSENLPFMDAMTLETYPHCRILCRSTPTPESRNVCYGDSPQLNASCPAGATTKWFKDPDYMTVLGTSPVFSANTTNNGNTVTYVARCYNPDECIVAEKRFILTISPPPVAWVEPVNACYGKYLTLNSPCNVYYQWINPPGHNSPSLATRALKDTTFRIRCNDQNGCMLYVKDFVVDVAPPYGMSYVVTICNGNTLVLNDYSNGSGCTWMENTGSPNILIVPGSGFVPSPGHHSYSGECTDASGCISKFDVEVDVVNPGPSTNHEMCFKPGPQYFIPFTCAPGCTQQWTKNGVAQANPGMVDGPGIYEVTCTAGSCIIRKATFNVILDENCNQNILCYQENTPVNIIVPPGTATIQCLKNGSIYPMSGSTLTPNGPGTYVVDCKNGQGNILSKQYFYYHRCDGTADKRTPGFGSAEQAETEIGAGVTTVKLYPNPGSGIINLEVKAHEPVSYQVKVFDMVGRVIIDEQKASSEKNMMLDLSGYAKGVYNVQVTIDGVLYNNRVMLQ